MIPRYERVRVDGRTIFLRDPAEVTFLGTPALTGIEVDREGEDIAPAGADQRRQIIELALVTKRTPVVMDNHYGMLVEEAS